MTIFCLLGLLACTLPLPDIAWNPSQPAEGSLALITVRADSLAAADRDSLSVSGVLAGEPLHFESDDRGGFWALGAVPMASRDTVSLALTVDTGSGGSRRLLVAVPVLAGTFPTESLRVNPRFAQPPDSALAARIAGERAAALEVSGASHRTPRLWRGAFVRPVPGRVSSPFGTRREYNGRQQSQHLGADLSGQRGTRVVAANRGVVALIGDFYFGGRAVYLDHGAGLVTAYLHLSRVTVTVGDTVEAGQVIGRVGATGRVTGPHLHWLARYGDLTVDPLSLLALRVPEAGGLDGRAPSEVPHSSPRR